MLIAWAEEPQRDQMPAARVDIVTSEPSICPDLPVALYVSMTHVVFRS